ncbi:MAG: sigma factor-like helix-turn-helix DNA-binding protein [Chloroflexota bacterium]
MQQGLAAPIDEQLVQRIRDGDLDACRLVVDREGANVLRFAYLISGQQARAVDLAADAFVAYLLDLRHGAANDRPQQFLAAWVAERFLEAPTQPETDDDTRIVPFTGGPAARRYSVEDERTRLRAALARLNTKERAIFLLHQFAGLPAREISRIVDLAEPDVLARALALRGRVVDAAGINPDMKLAGPLAAAAMPVTRSELWDLIEDPLRARLEAEQRRERLTVMAIAAVAVLAIIALVVAIAGNPFGGADEPGDRAIAVPSVTGRDSEMVDSELTPEVAPSATPTPAAEVTDTMYAFRSLGNRIEMLQADAGSPSSLEPMPLSEGSGRLAGEPVISPDGERLVTAWYQEEGDSVIGTVRVVDQELSDVLWEVEVAEAESIELSGDNPPFLLITAIDAERVWVAIHYWGSYDPVVIQTYDAESGERLEEFETPLPGVGAHDIQLIASPELDSIHLFTISRDEQPLVGQLQMAYIAFDPEGNRIGSRTMTDLPESRILFLYRARLTPSGKHLYGLEYTESWREVAVHFFDLERGSIDNRVRLPFQPVANPLPYQHTVSHDGRWLYVISPATAEMAIVDIERRRLHAHIPLDTSALSKEPVDIAYADADEMVISPDGRTLYSLAPSRGANAPHRAGIWEIDVATWSVTRHLLPDSRPAGLFLDPSGERLYVREEHGHDEESEAVLTQLDLESGEAETLPAVDGGRFSFFGLADLYRDQYGRSPRAGNISFSSPGSESALANVRLTVTPERLEEGERVELDVQFTDPWSGEPVSEDDASSRVRYTVPDIVQVTLWPEGRDNPQVVNLGPSGDGRYFGTARLDQAGSWSTELNITWPDDGPHPRTMESRSVIRVDAPPTPVPGSDNPVINRGPNH